MTDPLLWVFLRFVLLYGLAICCLTVHELGHALAARLMGYPVLRFTIGSGPVRYSRTVSSVLLELRTEFDDGSVACVVDDETSWKHAFVRLSGPALEMLFGALLTGVSALHHWDIFYGMFALGLGAYSFAQFEPNSDVKKAFEVLLKEDVFLRPSVRLLFRVSFGAFIFTLIVISVIYNISILRPH